MTSRSPEQNRQDEMDRDWVLGLMSSVQLRAFFGSLTLKFEGGVLKRVVKEESLVPPKPPTH